jgi:hypothetical protein
MNLRFSLRSLFIAVTLICIVLGSFVSYNLNWIRERHKWRAWLDRHAAGGSIGYNIEPRPPLPWSLALFGESALQQAFVHPYDNENFSPDDKPMEKTEYARCVASAAQAFPECQIVVIDVIDDSN